MHRFQECSGTSPSFHPYTRRLRLASSRVPGAKEARSQTLTAVVGVGTMLDAEMIEAAMLPLPPAMLGCAPVLQPAPRGVLIL